MNDLGKDVETATGLSSQDRIVASPPDGIATGDQVRVVGGPAPGSSPTAVTPSPATASAK